MESKTQQNSLAAAFNSLPEQIKDWAASLQTTYLIMELNKKLGFKNEKITIIPGLIFRLVTQNIDPSNFINELSHELNISFQTAKSIAQEIEERILRPVENELRRDVGVDVKLIYFGQPHAKNAPSAPLNETLLRNAGPYEQETTLAPINKTQEKIMEPVVDLSSFEIKSRGPVAAKGYGGQGPAAAKSYGGQGKIPPTIFGQTFSSPSVDSTDSLQTSLGQTPSAPLRARKPENEPEIPSSPFVLHQENQETSTPSPTPTTYPQTKIGLSTKIQDYYQSQPQFSKPEPNKPVTVKLETFEKNHQPESDNSFGSTDKHLDAAQSRQKTVRVVHYSGLRTQINDNGMAKTDVAPENTVDLRKIFNK